MENIVAAGHPELSCEHLMLVEFAHLFNKEDLEAACFNLNYCLKKKGFDLRHEV